MGFETRDVLDNLNVTLEKAICVSNELFDGYFATDKQYALYSFNKYSTIANILCDYLQKANEMLTELLEKEDENDA